MFAQLPKTGFKARKICDKFVIDYYKSSQKGVVLNKNQTQQLKNDSKKCSDAFLPPLSKNGQKNNNAHNIVQPPKKIIIFAHEIPQKLHGGAFKLEIHRYVGMYNPKRWQVYNV